MIFNRAMKEQESEVTGNNEIMSHAPVMCYRQCDSIGLIASHNLFKNLCTILSIYRLPRKASI